MGTYTNNPLSSALTYTLSSTILYRVVLRGEYGATGNANRKGQLLSSVITTFASCGVFNNNDEHLIITNDFCYAKTGSNVLIPFNFFKS